MNDLNEYDGVRFNHEFDILKTQIFHNSFDELPKIKKTCLLFDFDDCLTNMHKLQIEKGLKDINDDNLEKFLDTYTIQAEPKEQIWDIIFGKKSRETVMILTGNKAENILEWLFKHNREKYINHVFSTWTDNNKNLEETALKKRKILEWVSKFFDEIIFFDDSDDNLSMALNIPNIRAIKVSTEYLEE